MNWNRFKLMVTLLVLTVGHSFAQQPGGVGLTIDHQSIFALHKQENFIIIERCEDFTLFKTGLSDCLIREDAGNRVIALEIFKTQLEDILLLEKFNSMFKGSALSFWEFKSQYKNILSSLIDIDSFAHAKELEKIDSSLARIKPFIEEHGKTPELEKELKELQQRREQIEIESEIAADADSFKVYREKNEQQINGLINMIGGTSLTEMAYSEHMEESSFNLLKNYAELGSAMFPLFAKISAGEFYMGSPLGETKRGNDEYRHKVTLRKDFEMQTTEVNQLQYFLEMGENPSEFREARYCPKTHMVIRGVEICPKLPVENTSWYDAKKFVAKKMQEMMDTFIAFPGKRNGSMLPVLKARPPSIWGQASLPILLTAVVLLR